MMQYMPRQPWKLDAWMGTDWEAMSTTKGTPWNVGCGIRKWAKDLQEEAGPWSWSDWTVVSCDAEFMVKGKHPPGGG